MTMLATIPALIRIALIFLVIIIAIRKNVSLANGFLAGSLMLAVFFRLSPPDTAGSVWSCLSDPKTLSLCVIIALILVFSKSLEDCGQLKRLLDNFQGLVKSPRLNLAVFPSLIGLLPMPGGAVFSAPMVKKLGEESGLPPSTLSYINYWFRHIWEYWWPMYPGVLLATLLADINLAHFIGLMLPFTLVVMRLGWLPVKQSRLRQVAIANAVRKPIRPFIREIAPILVVILAGIAIGWALSAGFHPFTIGKETGLIIALIFGNVLVWKTNGLSSGDIRKILTTSQVLRMVYMVAAILLFKQILEDSGAVDRICSELTGLHIPLLFICAFLPCIVGVLTGITIAFVGSTFPILISLITSHAGGQAMMPYIMLALTCGFAGVLLSPVHLCLLLSNEYFGTSLKPVYRLLWGPCGLLVICAFAYFFLLSHGMG